MSAEIIKTQSELDKQKQKKKETLACPHCTKKFEQVRPKQLFCSDKCRNAKWRLEHRVCDKEVELLRIELKNEIARSTILAQKLEVANKTIEDLKINQGV